jgi:hypothetical protein
MLNGVRFVHVPKRNVPPRSLLPAGARFLARNSTSFRYQFLRRVRDRSMPPKWSEDEDEDEDEQEHRNNFGASWKSGRFPYLTHTEPATTGFGKYIRSRSLTAMRQALPTQCHARLCLGGPLSPREGATWRLFGIIEETLYAYRAKQPLFISSALGGASKALSDAILHRRIDDKARSGFFRNVSFKHIDELFTAQVDWDLIAALAPDMMRAAVSIRTGNTLAFRYSPTTQQQLTQKQALLRVPRTGPSSADNFLTSLSFRCRATPPDSSRHQQK